MPSPMPSPIASPMGGYAAAEMGGYAAAESHHQLAMEQHAGPMGAWAAQMVAPPPPSPVMGAWPAVEQYPAAVPTLVPPPLSAPPLNAMQAAAAQSMAPPMAPSWRPGSLVEMAQEQEGSRLLQQHLWAMGPSELECAVAELAPHLPFLAVHTFGNYLVSAMAALPAFHAPVLA